MKRIPSLDGLRAISITAVVVGHIAKALHSTVATWAFGNTAVKVFFVISGYLITKLLIGEYDRTSSISLREFYLRRAYRILPAGFAFIAVAVIIDWHQMTWYHVASAAFYLACYDYTRPWIFGHLWSLSVEEQFYLLWPGVLKRWYRHRLAILLGVMAFTPLLRLVFYYFKVPVGGEGLFPALADNLAIGCLLAILEPRIPKISGYAAIAMTLAVMFLPFYPARTVPRTVFSLFVLHPLFYVSIAGVILHVIRRPYRFLNCKPIVWLGQISYSLYLWQEPFCPNPRFRPGYAILYALTAACVSYYAIERPALNFRNRRAKRCGNRVPETLLAEPASAASVH